MVSTGQKWSWSSLFVYPKIIFIHSMEQQTKSCQYNPGLHTDNQACLFFISSIFFGIWCFGNGVFMKPQLQTARVACTTLGKSCYDAFRIQCSFTTSVDQCNRNDGHLCWVSILEIHNGVTPRAHIWVSILEIHNGVTLRAHSWVSILEINNGVTLRAHSWVSILEINNNVDQI